MGACRTVHGGGGRGDGRSKPPGAQVPDFTSAAFQRARTDAQLAEVIRLGRGMMPAFDKQLNEDGVRVLVVSGPCVEGGDER